MRTPSARSSVRVATTPGESASSVDSVTSSTTPSAGPASRVLGPPDGGVREGTREHPLPEFVDDLAGLGGGMNGPGCRTPRSGWRQRTSASIPTVRLPDSCTTGG